MQQIIQNVTENYDITSDLRSTSTFACSEAESKFSNGIANITQMLETFQKIQLDDNDKDNVSSTTDKLSMNDLLSKMMTDREVDFGEFIGICRDWEPCNLATHSTHVLR